MYPSSMINFHYWIYGCIWDSIIVKLINKKRQLKNWFESRLICARKYSSCMCWLALSAYLCILLFDLFPALGVQSPSTPPSNIHPLLYAIVHSSCVLYRHFIALFSFKNVICIRPLERISIIYVSLCYLYLCRFFLNNNFLNIQVLHVKDEIFSWIVH